MKRLLTILPVLTSLVVVGQTVTERSALVQAGQKVHLRFDYPELISVTTWDKREVYVRASVEINGGENDEAFELNLSPGAERIEISNRIKDMDKLPVAVTLVKDGQKMIFKSKAEYRKYKQEVKGEAEVVSFGVEMDIRIEVKVPLNTETFVNSTYGMVEVKDFVGPIRVDAKYGGVDASIRESRVGELIAETNYGQIYSNLEAKLTGDRLMEEDFHTLVYASPGSGPKYTFESAYGNVYLRRVN